MDDSLRHQAESARAKVVSGALRGQALLDLLGTVAPLERDAWVDALLAIEELPSDDGVLPPGSVPYLPCGVDEIIATVLEAPLKPDGDFVVLGSGLGRAAILAHLLSGSSVSGIEIQRHLVESARARCAALGLPLTFTHANAAEVELRGSTFFMYAPFNGDPLRRVLSRLEKLARRNPIVLCAVDVQFHDVAWLSPRPTSRIALTIYDSCGAGTAEPSVP